MPTKITASMQYQILNNQTCLISRYLEIEDKVPTTYVTCKCIKIGIQQVLGSGYKY